MSTATTTANDYVPLGHVNRYLPPGVRVTGASLRRWVTTGAAGRRLAGRRVGARWFVRPSDVERFLADCAAGEVDPNG